MDADEVGGICKNKDGEKGEARSSSVDGTIEKGCAGEDEGVPSSSSLQLKPGYEVIANVGRGQRDEATAISTGTLATSATLATGAGLATAIDSTMADDAAAYTTTGTAIVVAAQNQSINKCISNRTATHANPNANGETCATAHANAHA